MNLRGLVWQNPPVRLTIKEVAYPSKSMLAIFTITSGNISTILGYVGEVFSDLKLLLFVLIGLPLGLWIVWAIIKVMGWHHGKDWGEP